MKAINYIYKNLNSLNYTILLQLLSDEGVDSAEELFSYLKKTTWNSNPKFLAQMGMDIEKAEERNLTFRITFYRTSEDEGGQTTLLDYGTSELFILEESETLVEASSNWEVQVDSETGDNRFIVSGDPEITKGAELISQEGVYTLFETSGSNYYLEHYDDGAEYTYTADFSFE